MDEQINNQIEQFLKENRKLEAIKVLIDATGMPLKNAKMRVEEIEASLGLVLQVRKRNWVVKMKEQSLYRDEIMHLIRQSKKDEAIEYYMKETGADRFEAQQFVRQIDESNDFERYPDAPPSIEMEEIKKSSDKILKVVLKVIAYLITANAIYFILKHFGVI